MALPHERGVEVACNLLDVDTPSEIVMEKIETLAADHGGMKVLDAYYTNIEPDAIVAAVSDPNHKA